MNVNGLSQSQAGIIIVSKKLAFLFFKKKTFSRPNNIGPNYNPLNNDYVYQIHVDNDGDAVEDLTFQFVTGSRMINNGRGQEVNVQGRMVPIPLQTFGGVSFDATTGTTASLNTQEYYRLRVLKGDEYQSPLEEGPFAFAYTNAAQTKSTREFTKAFEYAGTKTFAKDAAGSTAAGSDANYDAYVKAAATYTDARIPDCARAVKVFVGPRREPFAIALGEVFDLINIKSDNTFPIKTAANKRTITSATNSGNSIDRFSVTSFVLEVPEECLVGKSGARILGAWARFVLYSYIFVFVVGCHEKSILTHWLTQ